MARTASRYRCARTQHPQRNPYGDQKGILMPRASRFSMRKNPAPSSRQHGLCLAADSPSAQALISQEEQSQKNLAIPYRADELHSPTHAAPMHAATAEKCSDVSHLLTVSEVAQLLQVPVSWVYARTRHRTKGRLPGYRLGKYWRFDREQVLAWVERHQANREVA